MVDSNQDFVITNDSHEDYDIKWTVTHSLHGNPDSPHCLLEIVIFNHTFTKEMQDDLTALLKKHTGK